MLYVLNQYYAVTEYGPGSSEPARRVSGLYDPVALALDRSNNLYVANCRACLPFGRSRFGSHRLHHRISSALDNPDANDHARISRTHVARFRPRGEFLRGKWWYRQASPTFDHCLRPWIEFRPAYIRQGITEPLLVAVGKAGVFFVANGNIFASTIIEYAPGTNKILRTINDEISSPQAWALDA